MKDAIDVAMQGLAPHFKTLEKEVKSYNSILDISIRTLTRLLGGDKVKARKLKAALGTALGHSYIKAEDDFIILTSTQKLNKAKLIISKYTLETEDLLASRPTARGELVMKKSRQAGARLKSSVTAHIKDVTKFTSPELISTMKAKASTYTDTIKITLKTPKGREFKKLENIATAAMITAFKKESSSELEQILDLKVDNLASMLEKGKKSVKQVRQKRVRKKIARNIKNPAYYEPEIFSYLDSRDRLGEPVHLRIKQLMDMSLIPTISNTTSSRYAAMKPSGVQSNRNYLRYQTGRFANSVEVTSVLDTGQDSVSLTYSYMHEPYDEFTDGAKHGPGRNPNVIIQSAIRELMMKFFTKTRIRSLIPS